MKLIDLLEGKFGPGSPNNPIRLKAKGWKGNLGAIENKRRPESLFIVLSTWAKPNLTLTKALSAGSATPEDVVEDAAKSMEVEIRRMQPQIRSFFNSLYFQPDSVIFTYEFKAGSAKPGKPLYLELEINIDTVNHIDDNEDPAPNPKTGQVENLHLDSFKKPVEDACNKILNLPVFSRSKDWDFKKTKSG